MNDQIIKEQFPAIPGVDSADNNTLADVIGQKGDTAAGDSLMGISEAVKAKTDNLPTDPADASVVDAAITAAHGTTDGLITTVDTVVDGIVTITDNSYGALTDAVYGLDALKDLITTVDTVVDGIATINASGDSSGTFSYLDVGAEQTVVEITTSIRKIIQGIWLDLTTMTQDGTIKGYYKIDGTNYREFFSQVFTVATDTDGIYLDLNMGITEDFKITYEESVDEEATRAIPYSIIYRTVE